jgi:hypothetical protein
LSFRDITDIYGPIILPIRGKDYTIPSLTIEQGLQLRDVMDPSNEATLNDEDFYALLLGDALPAMRTDAVQPDIIARAAFTALADFQSGRPAAEAIWETGLDPKVLAKYAGEIQEALTSISTGVDATTKSPKRTNGTKTSPKK